MAMFVNVDRIDGVGCFQVGYAVPETYRGRGWAIEILEQGLDEFAQLRLLRLLPSCWTRPLTWMSLVLINERGWNGCASLWAPDRENRMQHAGSFSRRDT